MPIEQARPIGCGSVHPAASRRLLAFALVPALVAVLFMAPACSRQEEVELSGSVQDPSGAHIPHAVVLVTDTAREVAEATTAGGDGSFRIEGLPPSPSYRIEVRGPSGFEPDVRDLDLAADRHLDIVLEIEPIVEAIVISGPPPQPPSVRPGEPRRRVRVGGNVRRATLANYVEPTFPADAMSQGVGGTVLLEGVIGTGGRLVGISALNSIVDERLVSAASDAVRQWRYNPTLLNGRPVETVVTISVAFEIP